MLDMELRRKVDALWDKFWAGGLANPLTAIDQINYLLFLQRLEAFDDLEARRARAQRVSYRSVFDGETPDGEPAATCRWSHWSHLPSEAMFEHLPRVVFPWLKTLGPENHAFTSYMRDAAFLIPRPSLLTEAVNILDDLHITDRNSDVQGDVYEHMLGKLGIAGQIGQFRTPRHVIRAMVALIDPKVREVVLDPSCGTGGFLIAAYQHMIQAHTSAEFLGEDEDGTPHGLVGDLLNRGQWAWLRNGGLRGQDFDPSMVRIAAMNMVLHGISKPKVTHTDTLGRAFPHTPQADIVLANPPFAGTVDPADLSEDFRTRTRKTELLFLQLIEDVLLPGGRAAVIVPDGVLTSESRAYTAVRRRLLENNRLDAVISLPGGAFRPYAGVKTSVLLFTRGGSTDSVWMYDVRADGYTLDDRRMRTDENDLPDLIARWPGRETSDRSITVSADMISRAQFDLSMRRYQESDRVEAAVVDPIELLDELETSLAEMSTRVAALRTSLQQ
jgi:type I restriction enzyme M protein